MTARFWRRTGAGTLATATPRCRAAPIELPTAREFELAERDLGNLRTAYSPVFFSTREDGTVEQGLGNLALKAGEPVILVGNHQTVPLDTGFHVAEVRFNFHARPVCLSSASSKTLWHRGARQPR